MIKDQESGIFTLVIILLTPITFLFDDVMLQKIIYSDLLPKSFHIWKI